MQKTLQWIKRILFFLRCNNFMIPVSDGTAQNLFCSPWMPVVMIFFTWLHERVEIGGGGGCSSRAFQSIAFQNWQNARDNHGLGNHKNPTKLKLTLLVSLFSHILTSWCLKSEQEFFFKYSFSDTEQFLDRQVLWKLFERFRNWTQDLLIADFRSIIQLTTWFETFHLPASYWLVNYFLIQQSID